MPDEAAAMTADAAASGAEDISLADRRDIAWRTIASGSFDCGLAVKASGLNYVEAGRMFNVWALICGRYPKEMLAEATWQEAQQLRDLNKSYWKAEAAITEWRQRQ